MNIIDYNDNNICNNTYVIIMMTSVYVCKGGLR